MLIDIIVAILTIAVNVITLVMTFLEVDREKIGRKVAARIVFGVLAVSILAGICVVRVAKTSGITVKPGDSYLIGNYKQEGNTADAIKWIVLEVTEEKALLISDKALVCRPFHDEAIPVSWENSDLRKWLNDEFFYVAFDKEEQERIVLSKITNGSNTDTNDHIFLLSTEELIKYFPTDADRICEATEYAVKQGAFVRDATKGCWWWLRSQEKGADTAVSINSDGTIDESSYVVGEKGTVRPTMWVSIG